MSKSFKPNVMSKAFAVLRAFTDQKMEWGVNELARYLDIPVSSLHRILKSLREENVLQVSHQTGKYKCGTELVRMASIISVHVDIKSIARPYMQRVSSAMNESVYLGLYYPQHKKLSFVEGVHSKNPLQYVLEIGVLQPIYFAASGKVILANLDKEEMKAVFEHERVSVEEQERIHKDIDQIRRQQSAVTFGERLSGAAGIAAPIFDASQRVIGCITCVIPFNHFDESQEDTIIKFIKEEAENISHALGYRRQMCP